jgi:hypothetical protein
MFRDTQQGTVITQCPGACLFIYWYSGVVDQRRAIGSFNSIFNKAKKRGYSAKRQARCRLVPEADNVGFLSLSKTGWAKRNQ